MELAAFRPRAKARAILPLHRAKQLGEGHSQAVRESADDIETRCPLPTLDTAHIRPVQTSALRKVLLGELLILSELSDASAECQPEVFHEPKA